MPAVKSFLIPALLMLVTLASGCRDSSIAGVPFPDSGSMQTITISGSATWVRDTGPAIPLQTLNLQVLATGPKIGNPGVCPDYVQLGVKKLVPVNGNFSVQINPDELTSSEIKGCQARRSMKLSELTELRLNAEINASAENCKTYCQVQGKDSASSCYSSCVSGERKFLVTQTFSAAQVQGLAGSVSAKLVFSALSPGISVTSGPDLSVDGAAIASSVHLSNEFIAPTSCAVVEGCVSGTGNRRLLRFDGVIQNLGDQDFVLGNPSDNPLFEYSSCHAHYHLKAAMRYELLDPVTRQVIVGGSGNITGRKQGFCMLDMRQIAGSSPPKFTCSYQGLTSGWADVYGAGLDCQWVDVTGVTAGKYILKVTVNPDGLLYESNTSNNSAEVNVNL